MVHREARQRPRSPVPGPVGGRRARALQGRHGPPPRRGVPRRTQGRGPRAAGLQPAHRPARCRGHRGGDGHWYAHARAYAEAKWGGLAPVSRRSVAEALVTVTVAPSAKEPGAREGQVLRPALVPPPLPPAPPREPPPPDDP